MEFNLWTQLAPLRGEQILRQSVPEVVLFSNDKLVACFISDALGAIQRINQSLFQREILDRFLALAALAVGKLGFDGDSPGAILRRSSPTTGPVITGTKAHDAARTSTVTVLSVSQLRSLLNQQRCEISGKFTACNWSLQPLVRPAHDTLVHAEYTCDSFGGEIIGVNGASYQGVYGLAHEEGVAFVLEAPNHEPHSYIEVSDHLATEVKRRTMEVVQYLNARRDRSMRSLTIEFLEERSGHLVLHAIIAAEEFEAGYPLYPPKSVSDDCANSPHIAQRLWPSDVPSPLRAMYSQRNSRADALALAPSFDGLGDTRLIVDDVHADAGSDCGLNESITSRSTGASGCSTPATVTESFDQEVCDSFERQANASRKAVARSISAKRRVPRLPAQCMSARLPAIRGRGAPPKHPAPEVAPEGQVVVARERVRSLDSRPLHKDQTPRLSARDRVRSLDSRPIQINNTPSLPASTVPHALSARPRCESEARAKKKNVGKPPLGDLVAAPVPRSSQRPFASVAASIINPETHEQYELPQDGQERCVICTLPLPCHHSNEQCHAFVRKCRAAHKEPSVPTSRCLRVQDRISQSRCA